MKLFRFSAGGRALVCVCSLAVASIANADLKMVSQIDMSINGDYHPAQYATTYYKGHSVRIDSQNKTLLSNSETHKSVVVDHLHHSYSVSANDPAAEAAVMMKMMNAKVSATVTPTEEHTKIVGLDATKYLADFDFVMTLPQAGQAPIHLKIHMETWATEQLPVDAEAGAIVDSPNDMIKSLLSLAQTGEVKKELLKIKGFSLSNKITANLDAPEAPAPISIEIDYQCLSISQATINPAMFRIPSEYKNDDPGSDIDWNVIKDGS